MYHKRLLTILAALVAIVLLLPSEYVSAATTGTNIVFNYPSGFSNAADAFQTVTDAASFSGSTMQVTNGTVGEHEAGAVWYKVQQNITSFTTSFTFQIANTGIIPSIVGMTFCIQNSDPTTNPTDQYGIHSGIYAGTDANVDGYGAYVPFGQHGIGKSIAIKFDIGSNSGHEVTYPPGGSPNGTGLFIDGGPSAALFPEVDLNPSGINLNIGHLMAATIVYDGSVLTMTLLDTVTNAQFRTSWPVNIPAIVGGNMAYIGFTSGEIPAVVNRVMSWTFATGINPQLSTPTFSVAAGSYPSAQTVTISAQSGATVYYTTNGQQPTTSSSKYANPITINSSQVLQAVAVESGHTDSQVAMSNYQIAASGTPLINFPNGFSNTSSLITAVGSTRMNGTAIRLTDSNSPGQEVGAAWYAAPVNVTSFTTHYTVLFTSATGHGMTFCIQNMNPASTDTSSLYVSGGPYAMGNNADGLGYSGTTDSTGGQVAGLNTSLAVIFDLHSGSGNLTGLYTNGANPIGSSIDMTSSGVNLHSEHPLKVTLSYDGTSLAMTVTDSITNTSFSHSWTIDIPATVAGNTAYVGFTASTGYFFANQDIQSWTYTSQSQTNPLTIPRPPMNVTVQ